MSAVHVLLPDDVDDAARVSGGNVYDRRICDGLRHRGFEVCEHPLRGPWPWPDAAAQESLHDELGELPDDSVVLLDGLLGSTAARTVVPASHRLRTVVLVHLPVAAAPGAVTSAARSEQAVLSAARAVVTTSAWTRSRLLHCYGLSPSIVSVVEPGVDLAEPAAGTPSGGELVCVATVARHKRHDSLFAALANLARLSWRCTCVGALDRDPAFVAQLRSQLQDAGIAHRVRLLGVLTGEALDRAYADADLLVLPSEAETYGMVVTEALAHALPVVASDAGGLPEALGVGSGACPPGLLVRAGDPHALAAALESWLTDPALRTCLRRTAAERRTALTPWSESVGRLADVLTAVAG